MCRTTNEDVFLAEERLGLFVVCDGVGGRVFGELAAQEVTRIIQEWLERALLTGARGAPPTPADTTACISAVIRASMQNASRAIFEFAQANTQFSGMSTTASVVVITGETAVVGQVGDSRVYHARGAAVRQLTEDHTLANMRIKQGLITPERARRRMSPITRAIGIRAAVEVDIIMAPLMTGDRLLLCTDGLHEYLDCDSVLADLFQLDVGEAALAAVCHAIERGGKDNITALFVEVLGDS